MNGRTETVPLERLDKALLAVLLIATAAAALLCHPLPTHDGHQHAFTAFALGRLDHPEFLFSDYLRGSFPVASQGWVFLLTGLDIVLPFAIAERLAIAVLFLSLPLAGVAYARRTGRSPVFAAVVLALAAHSWVTLMGFYNFVLAFAALPLVAVLAIRWVRAGCKWRDTVNLGAALVATAWLHPFAAAVSGMAAVAVALGAARERDDGPHTLGVLGRSLWVGLPALAYTAWVSLRYAGTHSQLGVADIPGALYEPFTRRLLDLFWTGPGGISLFAGVAFCLMVFFIKISVLRDSSETRWIPRMAFGLASVLIVSYLVSPIALARWAYFSPRFLFAAMVVMGLAGVEQLRPAGKIAVAAIGLAGVLASNLTLLAMHADLDPITRAVAQAPHSPLTPLLAVEASTERGTELRYMRPTQHLPLRSLMTTGGVTPYLFAHNPSIHSVLYLEDPTEAIGPVPGVRVSRAYSECDDLTPPECVAHRLGLADRLAMFGLAWGEIMILHPPPDLSARLRDRGYRLLLQRDGVELWQARASGIDLTLSLPPDGLRAPLVVRAGLDGSAGWVLSTAIPPGAGRNDVNLRIEPLPAGPVDLEIFVDLDADRQPSEGEPHWRVRPGLVPGQRLTMRHAVGQTGE